MSSVGDEFWKLLLEERNITAARVDDFWHAPAAYKYCENVKVGMLVEACHLISESPRQIAYWFATVLACGGYYVKLRWLGCSDPTQDFFRNVAYYKAPEGNKLDQRIHPVGWCKINNKPKRPPLGVGQNSGVELNAENLRRSLGEDPPITLPEDFHKIFEQENECAFKPDMTVEVIDTKRISAVRPGIVESDIGRRIKFRYVDETRFVHLHEFSNLFYPQGWGRLNGREVISTLEYWQKSLDGFDEALDNNDPDSVYRHKPLLVSDLAVKQLKTYRFERDAKLEVIDLLDPGVISVGRIVRILQNQYLMIAIENATAPDGSDEICVHATSPILLPAGFAKHNGLEEFFRAPYPNFSWEGQKTVPKELLKRVHPTHGFKENQYLEVIGCCGTDHLFVGRIERVAGHLLRVHYEGYESDEDHFFPICSPDIYPAGWAHAVGHRLITPLTNHDDDNGGDNPRRKKEKKKTTTKTGKKRIAVSTHQG